MLLRILSYYYAKLSRSLACTYSFLDALYFMLWKRRSNQSKVSRLEN